MEKTLQLRTDFCDELIVKEHHDEKISCVIKQIGDCKITHVEVKEEENVLQKEIGDYVTIEYEQMHDFEKRQVIINIVIDELNSLFDKIDKKIEKVLVIGLGNRGVVSDALGPKCADQILVTSHLYEEEAKGKENLEDKDILLKGTRNVAVLSPGVMGQTGLESAEIVSSIVELFEPDVVLVIDALATSSLDRINRAIQINDTGIKPGSGVGNHRNELSERTLKVPVIAIGVATVTSIGTILKEAVIKMEKEDLIHEMNDVMDLNLVVTPKNMDDDLNYLITIIADALNHVVHPEYDKL